MMQIWIDEMTLRVPYLADEAMERDAAALLAQYASAKSAEIRAPIPIEDIVEKHLKLRIEFDNLHRLLDVPRSGPGQDPNIFGAIWLDTGRVVIDESLDPEARPAMSAAHRTLRSRRIWIPANKESATASVAQFRTLLPRISGHLPDTRVSVLQFPI
jgi:hypothetical protein